MIWLTHARDRRVNKQRHKEITPGLFSVIPTWGSLPVKRGGVGRTGALVT